MLDPDEFDGSESIDTIQNAIQYTFEEIDKLNKIIEGNKSFGDTDTISIQGFEYRKLKHFTNLIEVLAKYKHVSLNTKQMYDFLQAA